MSKVKASISMSLDGFITGPSRSEENPLTGGYHVAFLEPAPCRAFTVGDQGVPEHRPEAA